MRKDLLCLVLMLFVCLNVPAQLNESFNDGNFTADPVWTGNTADWLVTTNSDVAAGAVNSNTLRLNVATGSGITYLSTFIAGSWGAGQSWSFFIGRRAQAYTAANHVLIWLWASEANLISPSLSGYRIRIGDDAGGDDIVLQRVTNGLATDIIAGSAALVNGLTDIGFFLRVTRNNAGKWELFTSTLPAANGTGAVATDVPNATILQATATDNTYTSFSDGYIGFANAYGSGAAARAAQEFDQVQVSFFSGTMPAKLGSFTASSNGADIKLLWEVLEESNVHDYEVQCSQNGVAFTSLGSVKAANRRGYAFIHHSGHAQGTLYYRLKITDVDGTNAYSAVITMRISAALDMRIMHGSITITHPAHPGTLSVFSLDGKLLKKLLIPPNTTISVLDTSTLPVGWYTLVLQTPYLSLSRLFTNLSSR